jgi:hypothetical protein
LVIHRETAISVVQHEEYRALGAVGDGAWLARVTLAGMLRTLKGLSAADEQPVGERHRGSCALEATGLL